jgi:hypothetical protein
MDAPKKGMKAAMEKEGEIILSKTHFGRWLVGVGQVRLME